jgi:hypothetical protein
MAAAKDSRRPTAGQARRSRPGPASHGGLRNRPRAAEVARAMNPTRSASRSFISERAGVRAALAAERPGRIPPPGVLAAADRRVGAGPGTPADGSPPARHHQGRSHRGLAGLRPPHDWLPRTDRTDLPDTWRAAARSGETAGLSSWLDVVGGDSFCPDAGDEQA